MNQLSWLLYLAEVSGNISGVMVGAAVVALVAAAASAPILAMIWHENRDGQYIASYEDEAQTLSDRERARTFIKRAAKWVRNAVVAAFAAIVVAAFVPSKTTIYAIAASEMGEQALASPTGTKALKALDAWLDRQISPEVAQ